MIGVRIEHATRDMRAPADMEDCSTLSIRDVIVADTGMRYMVSAWQPDADEIAAIVRGESVKLWIAGTAHPVVALSVGDIEK